MNKRSILTFPAARVIPPDGQLGFRVAEGLAEMCQGHQLLR